MVPSSEVHCETEDAPPMERTASLASARKKLWQRAAVSAVRAYERSHFVEDPWADLKELPVERAIRYLYDPESGWSQHEALVKIDMDKVFAAGAMRNCFRVKMFPLFTPPTHVGDWTFAENYLGKMYIKQEVDNRAAVLEDVTMQMDCKRWAEKFNAAAFKAEKQTPARVDMIRISGLELIDRGGKPMLCCEHFIEGDYIKYNSNSGYIKASADHKVRNTPQAFSHFTYEASNGKLLVVDVQGVGDLYTDPQIHSVDHSEYKGDANLGLRGIAYFFASHKCNSICKALKLHPLSTCDADAARNGIDADEGLTLCGSQQLQPCQPLQTSQIVGHIPSNTIQRMPSNARHERIRAKLTAAQGRQDLDVPGSTSVAGCQSLKVPRAMVHQGRMTDEKAKQVRVVESEVPSEPRPEGAVHMEWAKMHLQGCFTSEPDEFVALFHLQLAAQHGERDALWALSQLYRGDNATLLPGLKLDEDLACSARLAALAADRGQPDALFSMARQAPMLSQRKAHYEKVIAMGGGDSAWGDGLYQLQHELAEIMLVGGEGLEADPTYAADLWTQAAEGAMEEGKMKLWQKYSALAEEATACLE